MYKATTLPSTLARDFNNKNTNNNEVIHERKSIQSLIDSSKKPPYTRIDTILTNFIPEEYGEGFYGMEVGDVPCRPAFLQKMDLDAVDKNSNPVLRTNHPNLLNLLDISVCGDKLFLLHYEWPGISLGKLHKSIMLDRVAVATICKKVLKYYSYIKRRLMRHSCYMDSSISKALMEPYQPTQPFVVTIGHQAAWYRMDL